MINWTFKHFSELTVDELYKILTLRNLVFVVEQNCVYPDTDDKDQQSHHLCGWIDGTLAAYSRILPPGTSYPEASIGRVVTHPLYRKGGYGKQLMELSIEKTRKEFNVRDIRIGAQVYLIEFYSHLGFRSTGETYLEDGIPHIQMLLAK
jgi:ElaA protein